MLADLDGTVIHSARSAVTPDADPVTRLTAMDTAIADCLAGAGMDADDLWAITVGVTGPVDATGRTTLFTPLPGWTSVNPAEHLGARFAAPIQVENDCKLAAVAERWHGVARDADDIVYLMAGMRTGAGLIIDGTLRRGYGGAAGEIGALRLPATVASDDAAAWVFSAARAGDKAAQTAVRRYVRDLAVGTAALVLTLDPQIVVVGGGYSRSADILLEPLERELQRLCLRVPEIRASSLGDESVALGALRLALDEVDIRLFGTGLSAPLPPRRQ